MSRIFRRSDGMELEILYPPYCEVCGEPIPDSFAEHSPFCRICKDLPDRSQPLIRTRAFGKYLFDSEFPSDRLSDEIRRSKSDHHLLPGLLECLCYAIDHQYTHLQSLDVVVPVMRGSNDGTTMVADLAEGLATRYEFQYLDILYKKDDYPAMHDLHDLQEKERAISDKIGCRHRFDGESILLIDDTYISGVTKRECARVLHDHGAGEIWSLVIGRKVNRHHLDVLRRYNG